MGLNSGEIQKRIAMKYDLPFDVGGPEECNFCERLIELDRIYFCDCGEAVCQDCFQVCKRCDEGNCPDCMEACGVCQIDGCLHCLRIGRIILCDKCTVSSTE